MKIISSVKIRSSSSFFKAIFSSPSNHKNLWLVLAIFAVGAFGNSVQAQTVWLNDTLSGYTTDNVPLTTAASPQLLATPGSSWTVLGAGSPKKLRTYKPAGATTPFGSAVSSGNSRLCYKLSSDSGNAIDRGAVGYLSYKVTPNANAGFINLFNANAVNSSWLEVGLGTTGTVALQSSSQTFLSARHYYNLSSVTPQFSVAFYMNNANLQVNPFSTSKIALTSGANTIKIWYNKGASDVLYTPPGSSSAVTLSANSWVAYVNDVLATGFQQTGLTFLNSVAYSTAALTVDAATSSSVGKLGAFNGASGHGYDFSLSDIFVADTAPSSGVGITSETTATAQAGYPFSYTIKSSGVTSPVYSTSTLPSGLGLNSSTGVIFGTLSTTATQGLNSIELTASGTGGPATANLELTITAPPDAAPAITSPATASGFLTKAFTYQIATSTTSPSSTPTSYAIATGTLPAGLSFSTTTGLIRGTPTALTPDEGTQITYTATNPFGTSDAQTLTITINPAPVFTWNNTGTAWTNGSSWTNGVAPTNSATADIAAFGNVGSSATSVDVGTGQSIGGIVFNSGAYAYTWSGTDITVGATSGITNNSTAIQTFGNNILNTGGDPIWSSVFGGSLVFNGAIDLSTTGVSRKLTIAGAGNVTVNGVIANGGGSSAGQVYKSGTGTLMLNGANTYTGTTEVGDGTMILSAPNSSTSYKLGGYDTNIFPVLKVSATNALSLSATLAGSSSSTKTGTLEFTTNGNYTLNQYAGNNMNFSNSSGSATTLTFTNATNVLSTGGGRTFANQSANLTITFNGEVDIAGNTNNTCTISAVGPVVISNRVFNSNTNFIRNLEKLQTGNLTMYGVNRYNGSTIVSRGTLSIPTGGSLINCSNTVVGNTNEVASANSASLNLAGAAGVVHVSTNGFVRGYSSESTTSLGTITSLQVQDAGAVEVAVGATPTANTWNTGGTIDFAVGSKVSVTGTPITGNTYTLMTASAPITFATGSPILVGATGWSLRVTGSSLYLEETSVTDGFADYLLRIGLVGTAFDAKVDGVVVGLKYAFGSANGMPQNNGVTAVPVIAQLQNGDQQMTYTFDVKEDFFDVNYPSRTVTYQTSTDLVTWEPPLGEAVTAGSGSSPAGFLKKQVQVTGSDRLFIRINVTR